MHFANSTNAIISVLLTIVNIFYNNSKPALPWPKGSQNPCHFIKSSWAHFVIRYNNWQLAYTHMPDMCSVRDDKQKHEARDETENKTTTDLLLSCVIIFLQHVSACIHETWQTALQSFHAFLHMLQSTNQINCSVDRSIIPSKSHICKITSSLHA